MSSRTRPPDFRDEALDDALARLHEILAIVQTIDNGDLLAALPPDEDNARDHQRAVSLLSILRRELDGLIRELAATQLAVGAVARLGSHAPPQA